MVTNDSPGPASDPDPTTLTLSRPTDIIAAIPYLFGYHPCDDLVVLGIDGHTTRAQFAACCALTDEVAEHASSHACRIMEKLRAEGCGEALVVGYGPAARVTPCVDALRASAAAAGVEIREALRVTGGRYWSYLCGSADCCPAEGVAYDPDSSPVPATAVAAGFVARRDRDEVRALLSPVGADVRMRMQQATARAEARCARLWGRLDPGGHAEFGTAFRVEGVRTVRAVVGAALTGDLPEDPDEIAWLGLLLVSSRVRDEAWAHIRVERIDDHVRLWLHVLRHVEPAYAAAPGGLLGFAAWQASATALAGFAVEKVEETSPGYSMAALVRQALRNGIRPDRWRPVTPEWLEHVAPVSGG